jgi:hypothetical protein
MEKKPPEKKFAASTRKPAMPRNTPTTMMRALEAAFADVIVTIP